MSVNGLVVVDKEAGWTSHDVVARCRRLFDQRRVGHAGTLDPDATGVLLVGLGRVTRLLRFLTALRKTYTTDIVLGTATSTLDASGDVVGTYDMSGVGPGDGPRRGHADGGDRAGAADGVGGEGRGPPAARTGPPGHRSGAAPAAGDRLPVRDAARPVAPGRVPGGGRVLVGHVRPRAGERSRAGFGRGGAPRPSAAHPDRLVRAGRHAPARYDRPRVGPLTRRGHARSRGRTGRRRGGGCHPQRAAARPGAARCRRRWPLGDARRRPATLLAVYEATETDRIRPAVVVAGH